jgi:hypothetical protein
MKKMGKKMGTGYLSFPMKKMGEENGDGSFIISDAFRPCYPRHRKDRLNKVGWQNHWKTERTGPWHALGA